MKIFLILAIALLNLQCVAWKTEGPVEKCDDSIPFKSLSLFDSLKYEVDDDQKKGAGTALCYINNKPKYIIKKDSKNRYQDVLEFVAVGKNVTILVRNQVYRYRVIDTLVFLNDIFVSKKEHRNRGHGRNESLIKIQLEMYQFQEDQILYFDIDLPSFYLKESSDAYDIEKLIQNNFDIFSKIEPVSTPIQNKELEKGLFFSNRVIYRF